MAERLVPEHEPLNLERSRGKFFPGTFFSDPAWIFQAAALLFPDGILLLAADQVSIRAPSAGPWSQLP
jgi:hypothetical protein